MRVDSVAAAAFTRISPVLPALLVRLSTPLSTTTRPAFVNGAEITP